MQDLDTVTIDEQHERGERRCPGQKANECGDVLRLLTNTVQRVANVALCSDQSEGSNTPNYKPDHSHSSQLTMSVALYSPLSRWDWFFKNAESLDINSEKGIVALLFRSIWSVREQLSRDLRLAQDKGQNVRVMLANTTTHNGETKSEHMHAFLQLVAADRTAWALVPLEVDNQHPVTPTRGGERKRDTKMDRILDMHIAWKDTLALFINDWGKVTLDKRTSRNHVQSLCDGVVVSNSVISVYKAEVNFCQAALGLYGLALVSTSGSSSRHFTYFVHPSSGKRERKAERKGKLWKCY